MAYAWDDLTIPQRHAADRRIHLPSGRTLGGSSSINGMVYIRGNRLDYDAWRDRHGCTGWGYADVLPYPAYYQGTFSADGSTLTGEWVRWPATSPVAAQTAP